MLNQQNNINFPNRLAPASVKKEVKYGVDMAKAIYSRYRYDDTSIYNKIARFVENRKYAEGLQDIDKFKDLLDLNGDVSYLNLNFQSVSLIPKFVQIVVGEMINQEYSIVANAVDKTSLERFEDMKNEIYANMLLAQASSEIEEKTGTSLVNGDYPVFKDKEEADIYIDTTLKQAIEIAVETCERYILNNNDYDTTIKERLIRDLVVIKIAATREYFDSNGDIRIKYVDPANLVLPYTTDPYHRDLEYVGEIIKMSFTELVELAGDKFTPDQYKQIYYKCGGNPEALSITEEYGRYYPVNNYNSQFKDLYVTLLDFEFASNNHNITKEKQYVNDEDFFIKDRPEGYEPPKNSKKKREVISQNYKVFYEGMWIVGTDYMVDYGLQKNMSRPRKGGSYSGKPKSRFNIIAPNIYDSENKSMVESMIPFDDNITIANLKLQQAMIKARPAGVAVDAGALEEVLRGKGNEFLSATEVLEIFDQTGNIYYRSTSLESEAGGMMNQKPIMDLPNGLHESALYFVQIYNHNLEMIRNITGINEARDGSTPDAKALVGVQKMAVNMSRNATRFLNEAYLFLYERLANGIALMLQTKAIADGLKGFELALGKENIDILMVSKDLPFSEIGVKIQPLPDAEERAYLDGLIQQALSTQSIELEDAMFIRDTSKISVKKATHLLKKLRKDKQEQEMKKSQMLSEQNAQAQTQSAMAVKQAEMELIQMQHQFQMQKLAAEFQYKMELAKLEGRIDAEVEMVKGEEKMEQIEAAMRANMDDTEAKGGMRQPSVFSKAPGGQSDTRDFD